MTVIGPRHLVHTRASSEKTRLRSSRHGSRFRPIVGASRAADGLVAVAAVAVWVDDTARDEPAARGASTRGYAGLDATGTCSGSRLVAAASDAAAPVTAPGGAVRGLVETTRADQGLNADTGHGCGREQVAIAGAWRKEAGWEIRSWAMSEKGDHYQPGWGILIVVDAHL